jgi:hypothetical protein
MKGYRKETEGEPRVTSARVEAARLTDRPWDKEERKSCVYKKNPNRRN